MDKNLLKLEYDKIIEHLVPLCSTYIGKKMCENLLPKFNKSEVLNLLEETTETKDLFIKYGNAPVTEIPNIEYSLKELESNNTLTPKSILEIGHILKISNELKNFFINIDNCVLAFPHLNNIFSLLYVNPSIEKTIFSTIIDENNIADDASKKLSALRHSRRNLESSIKDKLNSIIHSSTYSKFIMDPIITIRNDRYVIPVKVEYKEHIKGFIHDISFSGSTVFIEPISTFEINNTINNIKAEESIEIDKILQTLSQKLVPIIDNLKLDLHCIGKIDFCFAKAKYSNKIDGIEPIINSEKNINLIQARHPLIPSDTVVPINLNLGQDFSSLVITGPNTGGKTVTLKTVGLLCLMACSGLHIPAKEDSSIYVFDNIFADIGDEQSISESLSTFSSHIVNIKEILSKVTKNSLVLLDELGAGTDPIQGANLAISILEHFFNVGCLTISTTHYSEIKNYALVTNGFENASSEFDIENLKPTYKLIIGVPGKSNAFAISKQLGIPESILLRAESLVTSDNINIEELIKSIYDDKLIIEKEKDEITKNLNQITMLRESLEKDNLNLKLQQNEIIENAKIKAKDILLKAKEDSDYILQDLNQIYSNLTELEQAKQSIKSANSLRSKLNEQLQDINQTSNSEKEHKIYNLSDFKKGDTVFIRTLGLSATLISAPNNAGDVMVKTGNTSKLKINISNLEPSSSQIINKDSKSKTFSQKPTDSYSNSNKLKSKNISSEINVIGQNIEQANFIIDKYLDDCALANIPTARIVHGKGTGKLREGIHKFLKTHPHVKSFRIGTFGEGEMGVTVVTIK